MALITEGLAPFKEYQTWYRIIGDIKTSPLAPLVVAHGGPGCTHDYIDAFADLHEPSGRPIIHYDQIGSGHSTHLPHKDASFWQIPLFLEELDNLLCYLGIEDNYIYLGQSWGGMLGAEHGVRKPSGLKGLILANSPASMPLWLAAAAKLRAQLPADVQETLIKHETAQTTDSAEYLAATDVFYKRHVCRLDPWPEEVVRTFSAMDLDPTVYHAMNGPNEFHVIGTMKDWDVTARLSNIEVPTLLISGYYDEATPECVQPFADHIADVEWTIFPHSAHMPHVEERQACMARIDKFFADKNI